MRGVRVGLAIVVSLAAAAFADSQPSPSAPPSAVLALRPAGLKGEPAQLAWSPDSTTLCLETLEGDQPPLKTRYYIIRLADRMLQGADVAPDWAAQYWAYKSARVAPGHPELVIQVDTGTQGGQLPIQSLHDKASNRGLENAVAAQNEAQGAVTRTLTLKGEAIGRYVNQPLVPGMTFGWSPESLHAIAYATRDGHLGLMQIDGGKLTVDTTKDVWLPAWSPDGAHIVYLQKSGRRDFTLMDVALAPR